MKLDKSKNSEEDNDCIRKYIGDLCDMALKELLEQNKSPPKQTWDELFLLLQCIENFAWKHSRNLTDSQLGKFQSAFNELEEVYEELSKDFDLDSPEF